MAKKVIKVIKLQIPAGRRTRRRRSAPRWASTASTSWSSARRSTPRRRAERRADHPGRDHGLRGPLVHLHHQDAAGGRPDQGGAGIAEGLRRAEPQQGRDALPGSAALDRRAQDARPERERRRRRDEDHRRHRPLDGRGGGGPDATASATARPLQQVDREKQYAPLEAVAPAEVAGRRQVRRDGRGAHAPRRQRPPRRPAAARHAVPAPRHWARRSPSRCSPRARRRGGRGGRRRLRRRRGPRRAKSPRAGRTSTSPSRRRT